MQGSRGPGGLPVTAPSRQESLSRTTFRASPVSAVPTWYTAPTGHLGKMDYLGRILESLFPAHQSIDSYCYAIVPWDTTITGRICPSYCHGNVAAHISAHTTSRDKDQCEKRSTYIQFADLLKHADQHG